MKKKLKNLENGLKMNYDCFNIIKYILNDIKFLFIFIICWACLFKLYIFKNIYNKILIIGILFK